MKRLAFKYSYAVRVGHYRKMTARARAETNLDAEREALLGTHDTIESQKRRWINGGPDCLVSWLVAFANFIINFLVVGLGRMSGILYIVFMHMFHADRQTASVPFSVQQAARNLFGPLAGILGQKYGVRSVTVVGGVIGALSVGGCYFVKDINSITLLWGLAFGLCTALTTTLNQVPIDEYFERHRTTAGGLAFSGGCVGAFLFPVVLEALISHYGMDGAFMGMGIILLIVIPAALTLRHPPWKKEKSSAKRKPDKEKPSTYNTFPVSGDLNKSLDSVLSNSNRFGVESPITFKGSPKDVSTKSSNLLDGSSGDITYKGLNLSDRSHPKHLNFTILRQNSEMVYQLFSLTMPPEAMLQDSILDTSPIVNELEELHKFLVKTRKPKRRPMDIGVIMDELTRSVHIVQVTNQTTPNDEDDGEPASYEDNPRWFFMATKLKELCETYNEEDIVHYFPSQLHDTLLKILDILKEMNRLIRATSLEQAVESINKNNTSNVIDIPTRHQRPSISSNGRKKKKEHSNSFLEHIITAIRLHKNPAFLLISMCRGVFMLTFIPMVTIVVDFAIDKGLTKDTGKYVIATLSLGDLVGRLCLGWITDSGCLGLPAYMVLAMLLLGCSTATLPFAHSEVSLFPAVLIFGMLQGSLFIRHQVLISRYMGSHEQTIGMGFINLLSGVLGFVIPYYLGYFRDNLGSYDRMFYLNGGICAFVGLLWLFEPYFKRYTSADQQQK